MNDKQEWKDECSAQRHDHDEDQGAAEELIDGEVKGSLSDWEEPQLSSAQGDAAQSGGKRKLDSVSGSKPWVAGEIDAKVKEKTYRERLLNSAHNGSAALSLFSGAVAVYGVMQAARAQEMINNHQDSGPAFAYTNTAAMVLLFVVTPILFLSLAALYRREYRQEEMYDEVSRDLRKPKSPNFPKSFVYKMLENGKAGRR